MFRQIIRPALLIMVVMTVLTGVIYPLAVTGVAHLVFHDKAQGSLIYAGERPVGSALIGQAFDEAKYFWSRPSATTPFAYNAGASSGSNIGPTDPALAKAITARAEALREADPEHKLSIPVDLVTASGSGLDPHISPAAAEYQVARVAKARGLDEQALRQIVANHTEHRTFGLFGEPRVNVVNLNLALDSPRP
jgi:potassium-transporting ATPase KdpC subunit